MALVLKSDIEQTLWIDIYKAQFKKKFPDGFLDSHSKLCADFADNAILIFRARAGKHTQLLPVQNLTNDTVFYDKYFDSSSAIDFYGNENDN